MNINRNIQSATAKDTYIMLMTKEQRDEAKKAGFINDEDIQRAGAPLSAEERNQFFDSLSFGRLLFIIAKQSMGKTEFEMDHITKQLEELKNEINTLSQAIAAGNELSAKPDAKDQKFKLWDTRGRTVTHPIKFDEFLDNLEKNITQKIKKT